MSNISIVTTRWCRGRYTPPSAGLFREPLRGADGDVERLSIGAVGWPNGHPCEEYELSWVAGQRGGIGFDVKTLQVGSLRPHAPAPLGTSPSAASSARRPTPVAPGYFANMCPQIARGSADERKRRYPVAMDKPGRVILLNGPSSSGKSSIGRAMLPLLEEPWFFVPVDAISGLRSTVHRLQLDDAGVRAMLARTRRGYHRTVAALASAGNDVIMDYPLSEPWRLADLWSCWTGTT